MKRMSIEDRINNIIDEKDKHLDVMKEKIDSEITSLSQLLTTYANFKYIDSDNQESILKIRNIILNLLYKIKYSNNIYEVMRFRDSFNYYTNKVKKILENNNISLELLLLEIKKSRKHIANYIRVLKRANNINTIIKLNNNPNSDKRKLKKLLKQEKDYFRKNKIIEIKEEPKEIPEKKEKRRGANIGQKLVSLLLTGSISAGAYAYAISIESDNKRVKDLPEEDRVIEYTIPKPRIENNIINRLSKEKIQSYPDDVYTSRFIDRENIEQVINYICQKEGVTEFQFFEMVSCGAVEAGDWCYDESYDFFVSVRNRTLSSLWVNDCERYTGLDGTSMYNQITWRDPIIQYSGYIPGRSGYDMEKLMNSETLKAAIDFFLSGEKFYEVRTHNFKSFNTHGYAPVANAVQLNPETNGNDYYSVLKESELVIPINLDIEQTTLVRKK